MSRSHWLGALGPVVLLVWVIADVVLRFAPPRLLGIDPWLYVSRFPPRYAPFSPNQHFHLDRWIGGNAVMANLPPSENMGPIDFSTDELGFRINPSVPAGRVPEVLLFEGDSFTYGAGVSDDQTLASMLTKRHGIPAYNGGRFHDDPEGLPELDWLLAHLPGRPHTLVYIYLEHQQLERPDETRGWKGALERRSPTVECDLYYARMVNTFFWQLAPTKVVATRLYKKMADGRFLPNVYRDSVKEMKTPDGGRMLFRDYEFGLPEEPRGLEMATKTADYFKWFQAQLAGRRLQLVVLMVPTRYTVYAPLLGEPGGAWTEYMDMLERELQKREIAAVNSLTLLRASAPSELRTGQLSFYREDTHWNPAGIRRVADYLSERLAGQSREITMRTHAVQ